MAVLLIGTGGLFTRVGAGAGSGLANVDVFAGNTDISAGGLRALGVRATNLNAQYLSTLQGDINGLWPALANAQYALSSWITTLQGFAAQTVFDMVNNDTPQPNTLLQTSMQTLITQMVGSGTIFINSANNGVKANTVSASTSSLSTNTGNGAPEATVIRTDTRPNEYVIAEAVKCICTLDAGTGATARSEPFSVNGAIAAPSALAWNWPLGSGASTTLNASDCALNAQGGIGGNLLTNSTFDASTVTANLPDNWLLGSAGTPGTDIFENSSIVYRVGNSLQFLGTGSAPLSAVVQPFNVSSNGTAGTLTPSTVYIFNAYMRASGSLAAGVVTISLVNSSNTVINDISGSPISFAVSHSSLTTSFQGFSFSFAAPNTLPSVYKWQIAVSTALTSGQSVYIDDACLVQPTPVYGNGPYVAVFSGSTNFLIGDTITVTVANNYSGLNQTYWNRIFNLQAMGLQLPSFNNGSQTISDTLISAA